MKKIKNLRTICLSLVAMALIITLSVGTAMAYFTTHTSAKGGVTLEMDFAYAEIIEEVNAAEGWKEIKIKNTGTVECYVRMKAFASSERQLTYSASKSEDATPIGWTEKDSFYEYNLSLKPGKTTSSIFVRFNAPTETDAYNVIVIQECTPVLHDNDGNPLPAKWDTKTDVPITFVGTVAND